MNQLLSEERSALLRSLPTPVTFTTRCANAPLDSANAVASALDILAMDYGIQLDKTADGTVPGALAGGTAGAASALIPGFIIFGPIGMAIGGILGLVAGGALGKMIPDCEPACNTDPLAGVIGVQN